MTAFLQQSLMRFGEGFFFFFASEWKTDHLETAQIDTKRLHDDVAECTVIHCSQKTGWHKSRPLLSPWQRGFKRWETSHLVFLPAAGRPKLKRENGQRILLMFGGRTWTYVRFSGKKKKFGGQVKTRMRETEASISPKTSFKSRWVKCLLLHSTELLLTFAFWMRSQKMAKPCTTKIRGQKDGSISIFFRACRCSCRAATVFHSPHASELRPFESSRSTAAVEQSIEPGARRQRAFPFSRLRGNHATAATLWGKRRFTRHLEIHRV